MIARMEQTGGKAAVGYQVAGGVATLTLNQPERRNVLSPELLAGLGEGLGQAVVDAAVRVIVVTHAGPVFCAGADLRAGRAPVSSTGIDLPGVLRAIMDAPKPVVARVGGPAVAGGMGIVAACDLSVAADDVRFGFTEVRIGVAPAIISVVCLAKMRRGDAMELFLSGDRVSAARMVEAGLVTRAVPAGALDAEVDATVAQLLAGAPNALAAAKELVNRVPRMERDQAFAWTARRSAELFAAEEAAEGIAAFRDKRPASWVPAD